MPEMNLQQVTTTDMTTEVERYSVAQEVTEAATGQKETEWTNTKASQYLGYYKKIPELKKAIDALALWTVGKGYVSNDTDTEVTLDNIRGWGEDTFNSILFNLMICKKVYGDCFAEIVRDEKTGILLNLKVLDPSVIKIIADDKGMLKRYEQFGKVGVDKGKVINKFEPHEIFHSCNDRIADEIHGTSVITACEDVILWKNEIMDDWAKVLHRNVYPVRIIEIDSDKPADAEKVKAQYAEAIKKGEVLVVPKGSVTITTDSVTNSPINPLPYMNYLDNFFYRTVGVPKIITGGSEEFTEASSKIAFLTFQQTYEREQTEFSADLWNQLQIKITFNRPVSLQNELLSDQSKDKTTGAFKPQEMAATPEME